MMELEDAKLAAEADERCAGFSFQTLGAGQEAAGYHHFTLHGAAAAISASNASLSREGTPSPTNDANAGSPSSPSRPGSRASANPSPGAFTTGGRPGSRRAANPVNASP